MVKKIRVLILGDVIGNIGRAMLQKYLPILKEKYSIDAAIVNGENSNANGRGITARIVKSFKHCGIDVITSGNHIWDQRDVYETLNNGSDLIRPANFPSECPGVGVTTFNCVGNEIAVINLQGRVFMREDLDCPFKSADSILTYLKHKTNMIIVDFHAEATAEKQALGYYLDGRVSCMVGTHTHVQTADERILEKGTAYISDIGMSGALNSLIGFEKDALVGRFKSQMPCRFLVDNNGPAFMTGVWVEIDIETGKALQIERIRIIDEDISV